MAAVTFLGGVSFRAIFFCFSVRWGLARSIGGCANLKTHRFTQCFPCSHEFSFYFRKFCAKEFRHNQTDRMQSQEFKKVCTSMDVFNGYGFEKMGGFFCTHVGDHHFRCRHLAGDELDHQYSLLHQGNLSPRARFEFFRCPRQGRYELRKDGSPTKFHPLTRPIRPELDLGTIAK